MTAILIAALLFGAPADQIIIPDIGPVWVGVGATRIYNAEQVTPTDPPPPPSNEAPTGLSLRGVLALRRQLRHPGRQVAAGLCHEGALRPRRDVAMALNDQEKTDLGVLIVGFAILLIALVVVRW
jgi:hypothetical protein